MSIEFECWPKTPRLFRDTTITEKIDGTNAAVVIERVHGLHTWDPGKLFYGDDGDTLNGITVNGPECTLLVGAQSRNRLISPEADNFGFARWVYDNAQALADVLGKGRHFGDWWGAGIQRGYGLDHKRFSLFNTHKWSKHLDVLSTVHGLGVVPVLSQREFSERTVRDTFGELMAGGSKAAPGFRDPEGIIIFHHHSRQMFKYTDNDDMAKGA